MPPSSKPPPKPKPPSLRFDWTLLARVWDRTERISRAFHRKDLDHSMLTGDIHDEAFARMLQTNPDDYNDEEVFVAIFTVAAYHVTIDRARKRGRRVQEAPIDCAEARQAFREATASHIHTLRDALDELAVRHPTWAMTLEAVHYRGEDYATIAARAGVSVDTVGDWKMWGQMAVRDIIREIEAGTFKPKKRR